MKTIILTIAASAILSLSVFAQDSNKNGTDREKQNNFSLSLGLEQGIPVGTVSKHSSYVVGGSLQGNYHALKELDILLNAGYLCYLSKDGSSGLPLIPVLGGLNYYITPKFFVSGQIGVSFYAGNDNTGDKEVYLSYAQGLGFKASERISFLAKYEGMNMAASKNYSFAGLRIAYTFGRSKLSAAKMK